MLEYLIHELIAVRDVSPGKDRLDIDIYVEELFRFVKVVFEEANLVFALRFRLVERYIGFAQKAAGNTTMWTLAAYSWMPK